MEVQCSTPGLIKGRPSRTSRPEAISQCPKVCWEVDPQQSPELRKAPVGELGSCAGSGGRTSTH